MSLNIENYEEVKKEIERLKKQIETHSKETIENPDTVLEFFTYSIISKKEQEENLTIGHFFPLIIKKYPKIKPIILDYVNAIKELIIYQKYLSPIILGFIPIATLAILDSNYIKYFEAFCKRIKVNEIASEKKEAWIGTRKEIRKILNHIRWKKSTMSFLTAYLLILKKHHHISLPEGINKSLFDVFIKQFLERVYNQQRKTVALRQTAWVSVFKDYHLHQLFQRCFHVPKVKERFNNLVERGQIPAFSDLENSSHYHYLEEEDFEEEEFDENDPDYILQLMSQVAQKAKRDKKAIREFIGFINRCDFNHPSGPQEEAEIMWEVISAWKWCPETVDLAATCFFTPAQWGPDQCVPMQRPMPEDMFDLFMQHLCYSAFDLEKQPSKTYNPNYQLNLPREDAFQQSFRFSFVIELLRNMFDKEEEELKREVNKAIAQNFIPTYQFLKSGSF